jgi:hypothetical protein
MSATDLQLHKPRNSGTAKAATEQMNRVIIIFPLFSVYHSTPQVGAWLKKREEGELWLGSGGIFFVKSPKPLVAAWWPQWTWAVWVQWVQRQQI